MKKILLFILTGIILSSCTVMYRAARYGTEDIDDYIAFPTYNLSENQHKFHFDKSERSIIDTLDINWNYKGQTFHQLDSLIEITTTRAFIVIRNDSILYEKYFRGYTPSDISTVFSVSKSVTSLLIGIALDEGYITDVNDPVTQYIPELNKADPNFQKLTIKHLLDMRSGIDFDENYSFNPFSKIARLYYGRNQLAQIQKLHFKYEPGTKYEYQSISTTILGIVIEKTTKQSLAKYFDEKVWKPLGMENTASWNLDDKKHQSAKAFGGLSITAIDLAKIGWLYNQGGNYDGKQIVSEKWITQTLTPNIANDGYQNQWYSFGGTGEDSTGNRLFKDSLSALKTYKERYSDKYPFYDISHIKKSDYSKKYQEKYWNHTVDEYWKLHIYTGQYFALGIMKQVMFIDPEKNTIMIRLGDASDLDAYTTLMYRINKAL